MRRRTMRPGDQLSPGHWGYGFSYEDCARGGRKSAEVRRARKERLQRHQKERRLREMRASGAWVRERDERGRFLPSRNKKPKPPPKPREPKYGSQVPEPMFPGQRPFPLPPGWVICTTCRKWMGPVHNDWKHKVMKHSQENSKWHPKNAARRSAQVRRARLEARKRVEEEGRAAAAQMTSISGDPSGSLPEKAPTRGLSAG